MSFAVCYTVYGVTTHAKDHEQGPFVFDPRVVEYLSVVKGVVIKACEGAEMSSTTCELLKGMEPTFMKDATTGDNLATYRNYLKELKDKFCSVAGLSASASEQETNDRRACKIVTDLDIAIPPKVVVGGKKVSSQYKTLHEDAGQALDLTVYHYCHAKHTKFCEVATELKKQFAAGAASGSMAKYDDKLVNIQRTSCQGDEASKNRCKALGVLMAISHDTVMEAAKKVHQKIQSKHSTTSEEATVTKPSRLSADGHTANALKIMVDHYCMQGKRFCKVAKELQLDFKKALASGDMSNYNEQLEHEQRTACKGSKSTDRCQALAVLVSAVHHEQKQKHFKDSSQSTSSSASDSETKSISAAPASAHTKTSTKVPAAKGHTEKALQLMLDHYCAQGNKFCAVAKDLKIRFDNAVAAGDMANYNKALKADKKTACKTPGENNKVRCKALGVLLQTSDPKKPIATKDYKKLEQTTSNAEKGSEFGNALRITTKHYCHQKGEDSLICSLMHGLIRKWGDTTRSQLTKGFDLYLRKLKGKYCSGADSKLVRCKAFDILHKKMPTSLVGISAEPKAEFNAATKVEELKAQNLLPEGEVKRAENVLEAASVAVKHYCVGGSSLMCQVAHDVKRLYIESMKPGKQKLLGKYLKRTHSSFCGSKKKESLKRCEMIKVFMKSTGHIPKTLELKFRDMELQEALAAKVQFVFPAHGQQSETEGSTTKISP